MSCPVAEVQLAEAIAAPLWFTDALAAPYEVCEVEVDGAAVRARCWGTPGPGAVLVHGGAAHAGWWDHIAPLLARTRRIVAVDLSGHGDSDRRSDYGGFPQWAREVIALAAAGGITERPYVVGHSMGGYITLTAGYLNPDAVAGLLVIDSPIPPNAPPPERALTRQRDKDAVRRYPSREAALSRFRLVPPDPYVLPYVEAHVAEESIVQRPDFWSWKFDPAALLSDRTLPTEPMRGIAPRLVVFRAQHGLIDDERVASMHDLIGRRVPVVPLPGTGHHAILDDPIAVAVGIDAVLECWAAESAA